MTTHASDYGAVWGRVKERCRGLSRIRDPLGRAMEARLAELLEALQECIAIKEEEKREELLSRLRKFESTVRADLESLRATREMRSRLREAEREFQRLSAELRTYEARAYEACGRYFERREEYVRAKKKVLEAAERRLEEIRGDFLEKARQAAEGYEIVYSGIPATPEDIFEELLKGNHGKVDLRGAPGEEALAKREVLDYLVRESWSRLGPVLRDKEEGVKEVEALYPDLKGLERACVEAESLREQAMKPLEDLRREIVNMRKSLAHTHTSDEKVRELRDKYLREIDDIEGIQ
jgi:chromosome segregation ATPase